MKKQLPSGLFLCPATGVPLRNMTEREVELCNDRQRRGTLRFLNGCSVDWPFSAGLISDDGSIGYGIMDDICFLLPECVVPLQDGCPAGGIELCAEKKGVREFYDSIGWTQVAAGVFADADVFEDLRPVAAEYIHKCHMRIKRHLPLQGDFLLDAASGPIQYPEYLTYSAGYRYRVCVDLSVAALRQARQQLGDHGIYLLADITRLPLRDGTMDAAVSLHTLYHVPREEQPAASAQLMRTLKPGAPAVIVYSWGSRSLLMRLVFAPRTLLRLLARCITVSARIAGLRKSPREQKSNSTPAAQLYFHACTLKQVRTWVKPPDGLQLLCWRSVSVPFLKTCIHACLAGRLLLRGLYRIEELLPGVVGRFGQYPLVVLKKSSFR